MYKQLIVIRFKLWLPILRMGEIKHDGNGIQQGFELTTLKIEGWSSCPQIYFEPFNV